MFLLLAAPSAPAEVTALHTSSRGAAMGTRVSSPAAPGPPARHSLPGRGTRCGWHLCRAPSTVPPWGSTVGRGLRTPVWCQPHLLLVQLSRDGFQLPLCRWCQQQHSHRPGTGVPVLPGPALASSSSLVMCLSCMVPHRCHAKATLLHPTCPLCTMGWHGQAVCAEATACTDELIEFN